MFVLLTIIRKARAGKPIGGTHVHHCGHPTYKDKFNIGLYDAHYFINDNTGVIAECLEHGADAMCIHICSLLLPTKEVNTNGPGAGTLMLSNGSCYF